MSGLTDAKPNQRPLTKSDFKSTPPIRGLEMRSSPGPVSKTYSVSTKAAKVWEKGGDELSGLFKTETSVGTNEVSLSPGSDDGFGDFQSVTTNTITGNTVTGNTVTGNTVTGNSVLPVAGGRERVGEGGIRRALPLMTSPSIGSPVLVHYQSSGPPVMATSSYQSPSLPTWLLSSSVELPLVYREVYKVRENVFIVSLYLLHLQMCIHCLKMHQKWLGENSPFLLHFLIHVHVLMLCRKFELVLVKIGFFTNF